MRWEIFRQERDDGDHEHVGTVEAPNEQMALDHARTLFARRLTATSLWAVRSDCIAEVTCQEAEFSGGIDKSHRNAGTYSNRGKQ